MTRQKKVVLGVFIHNFRWGRQIRGDERGYIEKVKAFKRYGIGFLTLEKAPSLQDEMKEQVYASVKLGNCRIPPVNTRQLLVLSVRSTLAVLRAFRSRPLAIYAYNQDIENVWPAFLLKVLLGSPLIIVYHQVRPGDFVSLANGIRNRIRRGFHPVSAVFRSVLSALNRFAARRADVSIALSRATRDDVSKYIGVGNCAVVGNGLDTEKFRPLDLPKTFDAVFLGRLAHQKGIDVLLRAWKDVVASRMDSQLILLGGGDSADFSLYTDMAKELGIGRNVTFTGFVEDDEVVRKLNSSKLFVFPSRKEGFAQAVSQAMGCGLCCLLSDIPPLKEVYRDAALYFPVDRPDALADLIMRTLAADGERRSYGGRARRLAENFSWDGTVRMEYEQLERR